MTLTATGNRSGLAPLARRPLAKTLFGGLLTSASVALAASIAGLPDLGWYVIVGFAAGIAMALAARPLDEA